MKVITKMIRYYYNFIFPVYIIILNTTAASAAIINVGPEYANNTIQNALLVANNGDTINVTAAVQTEMGVIIEKSVTIQGQGAAATLIRAHENEDMAADRVFSIQYGTGAVTIRNLSICNGNSPDGGGIYCAGNDFVLENCVVYNNNGSATGDNFGRGGGLYLHLSSGATALVENCTFHNNYANKGGAIACSGDGLTLLNCTICENTVSDSGGGMYFHGSGDESGFSITNCTIYKNLASCGGGICIKKSSMDIKNSITAGNIDYNNTPDIWGIVASGDYNLFETTNGATITGTITHNIYNQDPQLSDLAMNNSGPGTPTCHIDSDSPARDQIPISAPNGAPSLDQRGAGRNGDIDIGAYEYWSDEAALAVELCVFTARYESHRNAVALSWSTASEFANLGFIVERRRAGENEWVVIADYRSDNRLQGHGTCANRSDYSFTDAGIAPGAIWQYRLTDVNTQGSRTVHPAIDLNTTQFPGGFALLPPWPNPCNPATCISYMLPQTTPVKLVVYDILGRYVATLVETIQPAGVYDVEWRGINDYGISVPGGVYLVCCTAGRETGVQKVIVLR